METFDADWLALREPVDHRSRDEDLIAPLVQAWQTRGWSRVLDLGSGTGSNLRYLAPRLPDGQSWTLVDHDPEHLQTLRGLEMPPRVRSLIVSPSDLAAHELAGVAGAHLVTASALLDLTSEGWLDRMVTACARSGCGVLWALSYNGRIHWSDGWSDEWSDGPSRDASAGPATVGRDDRDADDLLVREAVNVHQAGDKGFGPALGPAAGVVAERSFRSAGYSTTLHESAWRLGGADRALVEQLIDGWEQAAAAVRPNDDARIRRWADGRRALVATGRFSLTVGHHDLLALPPSPR
jgi:SAM-dependent methyltransferase